MKRLAFLAILLSACAHPKGNDTAQLTAKLGNARSGVESARQSSDSIAGNVGRARTASERSDAKTFVILKWLKEQP
jgi:hypothetical protein